jgi:hypothetical protein
MFYEIDSKSKLSYSVFENILLSPPESQYSGHLAISKIISIAQFDINSNISVRPGVNNIKLFHH